MRMKSRMVAALLAFFLGGLGVHKFYLNQAGRGFLYFFFSWTFIPAILAFVDSIKFLAMNDEVFDAKYNARYFNRQNGMTN